jgi:hypothetical protein
MDRSHDECCKNMHLLVMKIS